LAPPRIPYLSNVTGTWIEPAQATDPAYWVRHLCSTVRFADAIAELWREPGRILLEMGPGQTLGSLALQQTPAADAAEIEPVVLSTLRHELDRQPDQRFLLHSLGRLWLAGADLDWSGFHGGERRRRVVLPTYPFERRRFWIEPASQGAPVTLVPPERLAETADRIVEAVPSHDRRGHQRPALPTPWVAPSNATEEAVAALWTELLGIDSVGARDDFFQLGGHSLLGLQLVSRLRTRLGVEIPLQTLFEAPTVADLSARIEAELQTGTAPLAPPLAPMPASLRRGPLPLSFAQQRLWFIDQLEPNTSLYNMPALLRAEGPLDPEVLALCLGEIVRRHETLRTVFTTLDGLPMQVIRPPFPVQLPLVDLSGLPEPEREALALTLAAEEITLPFDLTRDRLLRGVLVRLTAEDHVAAMTMHHMASDGWSIGVLVREVTALYAAFSEDPEGRTSPLPELPVQYADFAVWQQSWLQGEVLDGEIAFWRRQLSDLPPLLELPTDRPRPGVQSFRGTLHEVRMPLELTRRMNALSRREGATLFMLLLAGFQVLMARYSRQEKLALGTPVAGRNRTEVEGLIGFFVNTLVLRGDLTGDGPGAPSFLELIGRARATALAAHAHQD